MTRLRLLSALLAVSFAAGAAAAPAPAHLTPFANETAFQAYLAKARKAEQKRQAEEKARLEEDIMRLKNKLSFLELQEHALQQEVRMHSLSSVPDHANSGQTLLNANF